MVFQTAEPTVEMMAAPKVVQLAQTKAAPKVAP